MAWALALAVTSTLVSPPAQALEFSPCALTQTSGDGNLHADCAKWSVPLDRSAPDGEQIELFVARLNSTALEPAKDALTIINGGPGGSSIDLMVTYAAILRTFTRERDVIVVDQRGTGRSAPLTCEGLTDSEEEVDPEDTVPLTEACLADLSYNPVHFTTSVAVDDLEALRVALGYDQLSIYGVSYGTRVAMEFMRTYPDSTRSVIIDGVVPPQQLLGTKIAIHSQQTLDAVLANCAEDGACNKAFPRLDANLSTLRQTLTTAPVPLTLYHPITGERTELELTYQHLMLWLRFSLYAPETSALIPLVIHEAATKQEYLPIAANALRMLHNITTALTYGMHNAVVCTEDAPFYDGVEIDYDAMDASYIGRQMFDVLKTMCSVWPQGTRNAEIKAPLESAVPTLVLSGELDPITPPAWGDKVMPGLSRAKHLVAPGQGHGVLARGCIPRLALDFVEAADPDVVDAECLNFLSAWPFFVDRMGPPP